ncbi:hypothetical protein ACFWJE_20065 [Streptomyces griseoincarnatus]|uniref:hypothetical protein n=1 Tax=Streptomyces sp. OS603R TaxID=3035287 RepID=UPI002435EDF8|nr:hypothetical protein [Streptomyces sp. OS603R]
MSIIIKRRPAGRTPAHLGRVRLQRAEDVAFAVDLACTSPELLEVAARYDLADVKAAVEHARRPGKSGTLLLTSPPETGGAR